MEKRIIIKKELANIERVLNFEIAIQEQATYLLRNGYKFQILEIGTAYYLTVQKHGEIFWAKSLSNIDGRLFHCDELEQDMEIVIDLPEHVLKESVSMRKEYFFVKSFSDKQEGESFMVQDSDNGPFLLLFENENQAEMASLGWACSFSADEYRETEIGMALVYRR